MIPVKVDSRFPIFIEADANSFGSVFANMNDAEQIEVLRAMVEHMKPHRVQWDYIAIELERPENKEIVDVIRGLLP